jgi:hypothetical protein
MRLFFAGCLFVGACAMTETKPTEVPVVAIPASLESAQAAPSPAATSTCPPQPELAKTPTDPVCSDVTLKSGQSWKQQLTLQLSSGALTRIDCPSMRFHEVDTPICVAANVGGRVRGACCPPGHTNPTDPECIHEGIIDAMYVRQRVWEWCDAKVRDPKNACDPCVWSK